MNIKDIADLIQIRGYVHGAINNFSINKAIVKELNNMLMMLDKKIIEHVVSDEFKELVEFDNVNETLKEVMANNNIKTGRKDIQSTSSVVVASVNGAQTVKPERM